MNDSSLDDMQLISINPARGTTPQSGQSVGVQAEVQYQVDSHNSAVVTLHYRIEQSQSLWAHVLLWQAVPNKSGTVNGQRSFQVPEIDDASILVSLSAPSKKRDTTAG